jgi:hypothetical protein
MSARYTFEIIFNLPFEEEQNEESLSALTVAWTDSFIDAGNIVKEEYGQSLQVFISADSVEKMKNWMEFIRVRVDAYLNVSRRD